MKLVDCFTFYNELDLLEMRLEEMYDIVDNFVIVEATKTFVGKEKKLFFENNKQRYEKYMDKIIHVIVEDMPNSDNPWTLEKFQRNAIDRGISKINMEDEDIITICDVDEIPDTKTLKQLKQDGLNSCMSLEMDFYYYNLNCKYKGHWYHTKIIPYGIYKTRRNPEMIRHSRCHNIKNGGWHFSYFGSVEFIKNKLTNFSHQEYNNENYNNNEIIKKKIEECSDLFGRPSEKFEFIDIKDNHYLPEKYEMLLLVKD